MPHRSRIRDTKPPCADSHRSCRTTLMPTARKFRAKPANGSGRSGTGPHSWPWACRILCWVRRPWPTCGNKYATVRHRSNLRRPDTLCRNGERKSPPERFRPSDKALCILENDCPAPGFFSLSETPTRQWQILCHIRFCLSASTGGAILNVPRAVQVKLVSSPLPSYAIPEYFLIKRLLRHALSEISLMANLCNYVRGSGILCVYAGGVLRH
jgi:hypothetical protein